MALDFLKKFIQNKLWLKIFFTYFFVFSFLFSIFYYIQFSFPYLRDTDPWYHIKQAWLIRTYGLEFSVKNFPWLQHSIIKDCPGDPWLGYHVLLLPFTLGDLIFGAKLSAVFFATLVFLGFFWVLKRFKIRYVFFWTVLPFFVTQHYFTYRLLLARPFVLSIFFAIISVYFISQKKYLQTFLLSLLWVFVSPHVFLLVVMSLLWSLIEWWQKKELDWKLLTFPSLGIFSGLLLRPDFPNNLYLLYHQVFSVLFLRLRGVRLNFGAELTMPFATKPPQANPLLFLIFVLLLFYILTKFINKELKKTPTLHLFLFLLMFIFATVTLTKSARFIEYWVPFSVLFGAIVFNSLILPKISKARDYFKLSCPLRSSRIYQKVYRAIRFITICFERRYLKISVRFCFFGFIVFCVILQVFHIIRNFPVESSNIQSLKEAAEWLKENTPPSSLVMNKPWHTFPYLFFYNHQNYYALGMDPTFMYVKNPSLYWLWENIPNRGIICDKERCSEDKETLDARGVHQIFKEDFKADYLFLETMGYNFLTGMAEGRFNEKFKEVLKKSEYFEKKFERGIIEIYQIK